MKNVLKTLAIILGLIFISAGLGKIFIIREFTLTISNYLLFPYSFSFLIALSIIFFEILSGFLLIIRKHINIAALILLSLISIFIIVLLSVVLQGKDIICHCFGILNIHLSNHEELALDFMLFNIVAILVLLNKKFEFRTQYGKRRKIFFTLLGTIIILLEILIIFPSYSKNHSAFAKDNLSQALTFLKTHSKNFELQNHNKLVIFIRFHDFSCPLCFDDFIALCDSINNLPKTSSKNIFLIFAQDDIADPNNPQRILHWVRETGLNFPVLISPDSIFINSGIQKTSVIGMKNNRFVSLQKEIPLGEISRKRFITFLSSKQ